MVQLSAGGNSSFVVDDSGNLLSWGANNSGQLGDGTRLDSANTVKKSALASSYVQVSCADNFTLAIDSSGNIWSWGNGAALGDGSMLGLTSVGTRPLPTMITTGIIFTKVVAVTNGTSSSFALDSSGNIWAWGSNTSRQLGDGTTTIRYSPQIVNIAAKFKDVDSYTGSVVAIDTSGYLWAWGPNAAGQLGNGTTVAITLPTLISTQNQYTAIKSCLSHTLAIDTSGSLWGWGDNTYNQLGDGTVIAKTVPTKLMAGTRIVAVDGGANHSLALDSSGNVWAWGYNDSGQVGNGTFSTTVYRTTPYMITTGARYAAIAGRTSNSFAIDSSGYLWSWGINGAGKLGVASTVVRKTTPSVDLSQNKFNYVASGDITTIAIDNSGQLWSWGSNSVGQRGDMIDQGSSFQGYVSMGSFTLNTPDKDWAAVSTSNKFSICGSNHALDVSGNVWGWGANSSGQIGDGTLIDRQYPVKCPISFKPVMISADGFVLDSSGKIWTPSTNYTLLAGTGSTIFTFVTRGCVSIDSSGNIWSGATKITSGTVFTTVDPGHGWTGAIDSSGNIWFSTGGAAYTKNTTGIVYTTICCRQSGGNGAESAALALDSSGNVWVYGNSSNGVMGLYGTNSFGIFKQLVIGAKFTCISVGHSHVNAVDTSGNLWGWGQDNYGMIGGGGVGGDPNNGNPSQTIPTKLCTLTPSPFVKLCCGGTSYGIDASGTLWTWGLKLNPANWRSYIPTRIVDSAMTTSFTAVSSNLYHSLAIDSNGKVWTWGRNRENQLGQNSSNVFNYSTGKAPIISNGMQFAAVSAGLSHSLALDVYGNIWAWGSNFYGQAPTAWWNAPGWGYSPSKNGGPAIISTGLGTFKAIAAGEHHNIALDNSGNLWSWGYNNYSQLGRNGTTDSSVLTRITVANTTFKAVAAGVSCSFAIDTSGNAWAWGFNINGQLGNGTQTTLTVPTKVTTTANFVSITSDGTHTLAVDASGSMWAWGTNYFGQLGTGVNGPAKFSPTQITNGAVSTGFTAVAAGTNHSLAVSNAGNLWSWGSNSNGQLGFASTVSTLNVPTRSITLAATAEPTTTTTTAAPTTTTTTAPTTTTTTLAPKPALKVAAGGNSSFIIDPSGSLWSFGSNMNGKLGYGNFADSSTPISSVNRPVFSTFAYGDNHTLALDNSGNIWSWGSNQFGQLGFVSATGATPTPTMVPIVGTTFSKVIAGHGFSFAIDSSGYIWSSGYNANGTLGIGTTTSRSFFAKIIPATTFLSVSTNGSVVAAIDSSNNMWNWGSNTSGETGNGNTVSPVTTPRQSTTITKKFSIVTSGNSFNIALDLSGYLWSWGGNPYGQCGNGTATHPQLNINSILPGRIITDVKAGFNHTIALDSSGRVWTWGYNGNNTIGDGGATDRLSPYMIPNGITYKSIFTYYYSVYAIDSSGYIWSWGQNNFSQLGNGSLTVMTIPTKVFPTKTFVSVIAGSKHASATDSSGNVWTWGGNDVGQRGDFIDGGTSVTNGATYVNVPVPVVPGTKFKKCVGHSHSVALDMSGNIWTWGSTNAYGQLGNGTTTVNTPAPVKLNIGTTFIDVAAGYVFSVAIDISGRLWAWGLNNSGQLGNNTTTPNLFVPTLITTTARFVAIAAGSSQTYAIDSLGSVWAWGSGGNGQLANGTTGSSSVPVLLISQSTFVAISAAASNVLALDTSGVVWAWGYNANGQIGDGTTTQRLTPYKNTISANIVAISAGVNGHDGNATSIALDSSGNLWSWGIYNGGRTGSANSPARITVTGTTFKAISAGNTHMLALDSSNNMWGWGTDESGQLGGGLMTTLGTPTNLPNTHTTFATIQACLSYSFGIDFAGNLWGWGNKVSGQIGNATFDGMNIPSLRLLTATITNFVDPAKNTAFAAVSSNMFHSLAVDAAGNLWAWGLNGNGQLGQGNATSNYFSKTPITATGSIFNAVAAGLYFSLALDVYGNIWSWGQNNNSQLGRNATTDSHIVTSINVANTTFTAIAAGDYHGLAVDNSGNLWSWGLNNYSQLGRNGTATVATPTRITVASTTFKAVAAGITSSFAIDMSGNAWAWGYNVYGQLGNGTQTTLTVPTKVTTTANFVSITSDGTHTIAVDASGSMWTWGYNAYGQLGNGVNGSAKFTPTQITNGAVSTGYTAVAAGTSQSLAVSNAGNLWSWGSNTNGQLGFASTVSSLNVPTRSMTLSASAEPTTTTTTAAPTTTTTTAPTTTTTTLAPKTTFKVAAGGDSSFVIDPSGSMWSFGSNVNGKNGNGAVYSNPDGNPEFTQISCGNSHTLALDKSGNIWSWGKNDLGQLGNGTVTIANVANPYQTMVTIVGTTTFTKVIAGYDSSFAIDSSGYIWSCGNNAHRQLGDGTANNRSVFMKIVTTATFLSVSSYWNVFGGTSVAAIDSSNNLWTWGYNGYGEGSTGGKVTPIATPTKSTYNTNKYLFTTTGGYFVHAIDTSKNLWSWGYSGEGQCGTGVSTTFVQNPYNILPGVQFNSVKSGNDFTIALDSSGRVWTWGAGASFAIGDGTTTNRLAPYMIPNGITYNAVYAANASSYAIDTSGYLWTWGNGLNGQLGNGITSNVTTPTKVMPNMTFNSVIAGDFYTFATDSFGNWWSWGKNDLGQRGGSHPIITSNPFAMRWYPITTYISTPATTPSTPTFVQFASSDAHTLAIDSSGNVWSWGSNGTGQLGDGATGNARPLPARITSGITFVKVVATGTTRSSFALDSSGNIWAWGSNGLFQLGNGTTTQLTVPTKINVAAQFIAVSSYNTSVSAIDTSGYLWGWGFNGNSQLGNGTAVNITTPIRISTQNTYTAIQSCETHTLALDTSNNVWAWGANNFNQLGDGTVTTRNVPNRIVTATKFTTIGGGRSTSYAIDSSKNLWSWGRNNQGQIGDGTTNNNRSTPYMITTGAKYNSVTTRGEEIFAALDSSGYLWTCGYNIDGRLGNGTLTNKPTPSVDLSNNTFNFVALGDSTGFAIDTSGNNWTWGLNTNGQRGDFIDSGTSVTNGATYVNVPVPVLPGTKFKKCVGYTHSVALDMSGNVWTWGSTNTKGQLGNGTIVNNPTPAKLNLGTTFIDVGAGDRTSVAIDISGRLWVWGWNAYGQLGNNTTVDIWVPTRITTTATFVAIAAGGVHTTAIDSFGVVWAWGLNSNGELGNVTTTNSSVPVMVVCPSTFVAISAAGNSTLALDTSGVVWSWGYNNVGQIGNGTTTTPVTTPYRNTISANIVAISAGAPASGSAITTSIALDSSGNIWSWGTYNGGRGGSTFSPMRITGTGTTFRAVSAGTTHVLAVDSSNNMWGWGVADNGQLGGGLLSTSVATPTKLPNTHVPFAQIQACASYSFGIDFAGNLWGWGKKVDGEIGNATVGGMNIPSVRLRTAGINNFVDPAKNTTFAVVSSNMYHSLAVDAAGSLWAWGLNGNGQLGQGLITTPYFSKTPITATGSIFSTVAAGLYFSLALDVYGNIWSWGQNNNYQLGRNAVIDPYVVSSINVANTTFTAIAAGDDHGLAIDNFGNLWSWGFNNYSQLGRNGTTTVATPTAITVANTKFKAVAAGVYSSFAIDTSGNVWAWGFNFFGQLGNGTTTTLTVPTRLTVSAKFVSIASDGTHTVATDTSGNTWAWGLNNVGQLGDGTIVNRLSPVKITTASVFTAAYTGLLHTLAIDVSGNVSTWGANNVGQLGLGNTTAVSTPTRQLTANAGLSVPPPTAPTITGITAGSSRATVHFTAGNANGSAITNYKYSIDDGVTFTTLNPANAYSPVVITGLTNGTTYQIQLKATNAMGGDSPASSSVSATPFDNSAPPAAPTITAVTDSNGSTSIAFTAGSSNGGTITGYKYSTDNGATFTLVAQTSSPIVITGLTNGTTYQVQLKAVTTVDGNASASSPATPFTVPSVPTNLSVTDASGSTSVAFTAGAPNGRAITTYQYSTNGGYSFNDALQNSSPIVITGLLNGSTYQIQLKATNAAGDSAATASSAATPFTIPSAPTNLSVTDASGSTSIAFTDGAANGRAITAYKYSTDGTTYHTVGQTSSPVVVTGLTNGTTYQIRIKAVNAAGDGVASAAATVAPFTAPSAPTITSITPGNERLTIAFTAGATNGRPITNYQYSTNGGESFTTVSPAQTSGPVTITGLTNGTEYQVQLRAVNIANSGQASASIAATPSTTPAAPTNITVEAGDQQATVSFTAGEDTGLPVTSYKYSTNNGVTYTTVNQTSSPIIITGLANGTTYQIVLKAVNAAGEGAPSVAATVNPTQAITLTSDSLYVTVSNQGQFGVTFRSNITDRSLVWSSRNASVATVDASGVITAIAPGNAYIVATNGLNNRAFGRVFVSSTITGVSMSQSGTISQQINRSLRLSATVNTATGTIANADIVWSSSDTSVALVTQSGVVTSIGAGTATITAQSRYMSQDMSYASASVSVRTIIPVTSVSIDVSQNLLQLAPGQTYQLPLTVSPANASNTAVTWYSSKPTIASVNANGSITGVAMGTGVTIYALSTDGSNKTSTALIVNVGTYVSSVGITGQDMSGGVLRIQVGQTSQLNAVINPANATIKDVTWYTSNASAATVDASGNVYGTGIGSARIYFISADVARKVVGIEVYVGAYVSNIRITGNDISGNTLYLDVGSTSQLSTVITPANATNQIISWRSTNSSNASVDASGVVTGLRLGAATVIARTTDGSFLTNIIQVRIGTYVTSIPLENDTPASLSLDINQTLTIPYTLLPANATDTRVTWSSSDNYIVRFDASGVITGVKRGTVAITLTALGANGLLSRVVANIDVGVNVESVSLLPAVTRYVTPGQFFTVTPYVLPTNATDKSIASYASASPSIVSVLYDGNFIANTPGTTTITAVATDGGVVSSSLTVVVLGQTNSVETVMVAASKPFVDFNLELAVGESANMSARSIPTNPYVNYTWETTDPDVVSITENGYIVGLSAGSALVIASSSLSNRRGIVFVIVS